MRRSASACGALELVDECLDRAHGLIVTTLGPGQQPREAE